jgi:hypothetical protein
MKKKRNGKRKNIGTRIDFDYEEVLDVKTQGMIRAACAVVAGCPT